MITTFVYRIRLKKEKTTRAEGSFFANKER